VSRAKRLECAPTGRRENHAGFRGQVERSGNRAFDNAMGIAGCNESTRKAKTPSRRYGQPRARRHGCAAMLTRPAAACGKLRIHTGGERRTDRRKAEQRHQQIGKQSPQSIHRNAASRRMASVRICLPILSSLQMHAHQIIHSDVRARLVSPCPIQTEVSAVLPLTNCMAVAVQQLEARIAELIVTAHVHHRGRSRLS
jgi:hypothetical protein